VLQGRTAPGFSKHTTLRYGRCVRVISESDGPGVLGLTRLTVLQDLQKSLGVLSVTVMVDKTRKSTSVSADGDRMCRDGPGISMSEVGSLPSNQPLRGPHLHPLEDLTTRGYRSRYLEN
jgi:hypothetical protein